VSPGLKREACPRRHEATGALVDEGRDPSATIDSYLVGIASRISWGAASTRLRPFDFAL
jgi:hypothetical protein